MSRGDCHRRSAARAHAKFWHLSGWRLLKREDGGVLIYVALMMPVLMGFAGLAVDVSSWYADKRHSQIMVDSAVLAGALEIRRMGGTTENSEAVTRASIIAEGQRNAILNGLPAAHVDEYLEIYWPPQNGIYTGDMLYVEGIVDRPAHGWFSRLFLENEFDIQARAVAKLAMLNGCIYALNPHQRASLSVGGGARLNARCGLEVHSDDEEAMTQVGNSCIEATGAKIVGGYTGTCMIGFSPSYNNLAAGSDPFVNVRDPEPEMGPCSDSTKHNANDEAVPLELTPCVYTGGIRATNDGIIEFAPGVYVLDGAGLDFSANSTITGTDVFFYMTDSGGANDGFNIQAGADVTLSGATEDMLKIYDLDKNYAGFIFWHDREARSNIKHSLTGGADMKIEGTIYTPSAELQFAGHSALVGTVVLIADTLSFSGENAFGSIAESATVGANDNFYRSVLVE